MYIVCRVVSALLGRAGPTILPGAHGHWEWEKVALFVAARRTFVGQA
jgi:hypothetical protein